MLYTDKRDFSTALNVMGIVSGIILGGLFCLSYIDVVGTNLSNARINNSTMTGFLTLITGLMGMFEEIIGAKLKNFREISRLQLLSSVPFIILIFVTDINSLLIPQLFFFASGVVNYTLKNA